MWNLISINHEMRNIFKLAGKERPQIFLAALKYE